jgi:hypothetical protein
MEYSERFIARFWSHVDKTSSPDGCWLWTASLDKDGYGVIRTPRPHRKWLRTPRVAWELTVGPIPEGFHALHKPPCVTRRCVLHLYLGTNADNIRDCVDAARQPVLYQQGATHPQARLTENDVLAIRGLYATGQYRQADLAQRYGVIRQHISAIVTGVTWKHLPVLTAETAAMKGVHLQRGETQNFSKLTAPIVQAIRASAAEGVMSNNALARLYNVSNVTIGHIVRRKTWHHLP